MFAADGAAYNEHGELIYQTSKIYVGPQNDFLYSHVGIGDFGGSLAAKIDVEGLGFDDCKSRIVEVSRDAYADAKAAWIGDIEAPRATLIMAGWSQRNNRFEAFKLHSSEKEYVNPETGEPGISPPWEIIHVSGLWASSMPLTEHFDQFGIDFESEWSVVDMPARMVCANRAGSNNRGDAVYGVGCFLEMAILTTEGVKRWIAHEWPDELGFPIDPSIGEPMPKFPIKIP